MRFRGGGFISLESDMFYFADDYTCLWNAKVITVKFDYQGDKRTPFLQNNETANHKLSYSVIRC